MKSLYLVLLLSLPVQATVYKWVDKDGNVYYGDEAAASAKAQQVTITPSNTSYNSTGANKWQQEYNEKKQKDKQARLEKNAVELEKKQRCDDYQRNLYSFQRSARIYTMTTDGEREYISDEERASKVKELSKKLKKECKF